MVLYHLANDRVSERPTGNEGPKDIGADAPTLPGAPRDGGGHVEMTQACVGCQQVTVRHFEHPLPKTGQPLHAKRGDVVQRCGEKRERRVQLDPAAAGEADKEKGAQEGAEGDCGCSGPGSLRGLVALDRRGASST